MLFVAFATVLHGREGVLIDERAVKIGAVGTARFCVGLSPRPVLSFPLFAIPLAERALHRYFFRKASVPASYRRCDKSYPRWL